MGYCIHTNTSEFPIPASRRAEALAAIQLYMQSHEGTWITSSEVLAATTLEDAAAAMGWELVCDDEGGDIHGINYIWEKSGSEKMLPMVLAPFTEHDAFVEFCGEDGAVWRYAVRGGGLYELEAIITWSNDSPGYRRVVAPFTSGAASNGGIVHRVGCFPDAKNQPLLDHRATVCGGVAVKIDPNDPALPVTCLTCLASDG